MNALMRMMMMSGSIAPANPVAAPGAIQGQWVWPNIIETTDNIYAGSAGEDGEFYVSRIIKSTNVSTVATLGTNESDDHNVPAVIELNSGKILTAYSRHGLVSELYVKRSASVDAADFGAVVTVTTSAEATYSQLLRVPGAVRVWLLYRIATSAGQMAIRYSDDEGDTWSAEQILISLPYMIAAQVTSPNVYCYAYEHPISGSDHDIYHFRINLTTGDVTDSVGTVYGNVSSATGLPITKAECHKAVDVTGSVSTRLYDAPRSGSPALIASEFTDEVVSTYYRYTYDTTTGLFIRQAVCSSGPVFYEGTSNYFGGACFDTASQNTIYAARNLGPDVGVGNWVLEKYVTTDSGATWQKTQTVRRSTNIICRPQVRAGRVWWSEVPYYPLFTAFASNVNFVVAA